MRLPRDTGPRINERIRRSPVRLIDSDGTQLGIVPVEEARAKAQDRGLDLVEVGPNSDPPVCRILDWGKMRYEKQKKEREARKKATVIEVKEVKYRPTIDTHDRDRKTGRARKFLEEGNKVKVTIFFRYRQLRRPELGVDILDHVAKQLEDIAVVEYRSRGMEGRQMTMVLAPLAQPGTADGGKKTNSKQPVKKAAKSEKKADTAASSDEAPSKKPADAASDDNSDESAKAAADKEVAADS